MSTPLIQLREVVKIYGSGQAMIGDEYSRMVAGIDRRLRRKIRKLPFLPHLLIGSGGTFTSLGRMVQARRGQPAGDTVHGVRTPSTNSTAF